MRKLILLFSLSLLILTCKKENKTTQNASPEDIRRARLFDSTLQGRLWELQDYYADPNDPFIYTDTIPGLVPETNFYKYVPNYVKDDYDSFNTKVGVVTVIQNADKIETNDNAQFTNGYSISADQKGVYFNFLSYQYEPLFYRLVDLSDTAFIVSAPYNHHTVYSKFHIVRP